MAGEPNGILMKGVNEADIDPTALRARESIFAVDTGKLGIKKSGGDMAYYANTDKMFYAENIYGAKLTDNVNTLVMTGPYRALGTATGVPDNTESWHIWHDNDYSGTASAYQGAVGYTTGRKFYRLKAASTWGAWTNEWLRSHGVGSVYETTASDESTAAQMATKYGGTWVTHGAGRKTVGYDSTDTDYDTINETSGAKTHTISQDNLPMVSAVYTGGSYGYGAAITPGSNGLAAKIHIVGQTQTAMNACDPSVVVHRYCRTA